MELRNIQQWINRQANFNNDLQDVPTPVALFDEVFSKMDDKLSDKKILVLYNIEAAILLFKNYSVAPNKLWFFTQSPDKKALLESIGVNVLFIDIKSNPIGYLNKLNMKFDVVIGNPPFSEDAGKNKASKIWIKFVECSINLTKNKNSIVALITPTNFLLPHHKSFKLISSFTDKIYVKLDVNNFFKNSKQDIKESIAYFILNTKTAIVDAKNEKLSVKYGDMIPIQNDVRNSISVNIIDKVFNKKTHFLLHKANQVDIIADGIYNVFTNWDVRKTNSNHTNNSPKVYISRLLKRYKKQRTLVVDTDISGQSHILDGYYIELENNVTERDLKNIKWIFSESKLFRICSDAFGKSQYANPSFIKNLPKVDYSISTDAELYAYFNLTQEEIDYIESSVK